MKKLIFIFILSMVSILSYGQKYFNINNNKNISISIGLTMVNPDIHRIDSYNGYEEINNVPMLSFDASVYGLYISCGLASGLSTGASSSVQVDRHMDEGRSSFFHIGYKSPVTDWLYLYPYIGYASITTGYCDGMDYTISDSGIHNKYHVENVWLNDFDYGGGFDIRLAKFTGCSVFASGKFGRYTKGVSLGFAINLNELYLY